MDAKERRGFWREAMVKLGGEKGSCSSDIVIPITNFLLASAHSRADSRKDGKGS